MYRQVAKTMSDEVKERDCNLELTHSRHAAYGCAALCHVSGCDIWNEFTIYRWFWAVDNTTKTLKTEKRG